MKQKRRLTEKERNEKLKRIIRTSIPLKNDVFMIFARSKKFCQEFLRVILQDKKLVVIENRIQKVLPSIANKNVVLDMLCKLSDEKIVNVEIQLVKEKHHAKRIFTSASKIRTYELEKGAKYKDARDIIIIYLTLEDIFKKGSTVYEVSMDIVSDQGIKVNKWEAGLKVYYVNTKGLTNKIKIDLYQKGGVLMSKEMMEVLDDVRLEGVEKGMQQGLHQGMVNVLVRQFKDKKISAKEGAEYLNVTVNEFLKLVN